MIKENQKETKAAASPKEAKPVALPKDYKPRMRELYKQKVIPAMMKDLSLKSPMAVPKITKIVINIGVSEAKENIQALDLAKEDLAQIAGQMPQIRRAKKSISNFKLRQGMPIAVRVTLRGAIMYEFLDRFISLSMPRIRDFQGVDPSSDGAVSEHGSGALHIPEVNQENRPKPAV